MILNSKINSELTIWDIINCKICKKIDIDYKKLGNTVVKLRINFAKDLIMILTNIGRIGIYKMNELIKIIDLNLDKSRNHKLIILNDGLISEQNYFKILNLNTFDCYQISSNLSIETKLDLFKIINQNNTNIKDKIIIYLAELDSIIAIDKYLKDFTIYSYSKMTQFSNNVKFINNKDENLCRNFFNLFGLSIFKYKILYCENYQIYFVITALRPDSFQAHSSLIVKSTFITSLTGKNKNDSEFLIIKIYPFCNCYEFKMIKNDLLISFNYFLNFEFDLALDKNVFYSIRIDKNFNLSNNHISIFNLKNNHKIFELNVKSLNENMTGNSDEIKDDLTIELISIDSTKTYLTFLDNKKYLWLYKITTSTRLACLSLYGIANQIKFTNDNKFICLSMNDRRIYSLLIVDPNEQEHELRIKNLPSRQIISKKNTKQIKHLIQKKKPFFKAIARNNRTFDEQTDNKKMTDNADLDKISVLNKLADDFNSSEYEIDSSSNDSSTGTENEKLKQMGDEKRSKSNKSNIKKNNSMRNNTEDQEGEKLEKKTDESIFNYIFF